MTINDGIIDVSTGRIGRVKGIARNQANVKQIIYYNSDDVVLYVDEIYNAGTDDEKAYRQVFYTSNVTNSGVSYTKTVMPWERI